MRSTLVASTAVFLAAAVAGNRLHAADLHIQPHADVGMMYYEFSQDTIEFVQGAYDVSDFLPFVGAGVTISYDRIFADIYGQITAEGQDRYTLVSVLEDGTTIDEASTIDMSRKEATANVGYRITDAFSVLAGYKMAKVDFRDNISDGDEVDFDFTYHGPLAGVSYAIPIEGLGGAFHFTTAFTYLFGEVKQEAYDTSGESLGYNFGISWTGRIANRFSYGFLADAARYDFDSGGDIDFEETVYRLRAVLGYSFNVSSML